MSSQPKPKMLWNHWDMVEKKIREEMSWLESKSLVQRSSLVNFGLTNISLFQKITFNFVIFW